MSALNGLVPMTLGSWRYYDHELSVEDYYLARGQEPGVWVGSGTAVVGLLGAVEEGQLARLFDEGCHPVSGLALGVPYRHGSKRTVVTGFALSFSPPKSVSLVGAFGDAATAGEVRAAHESAVLAALSFLEDHAAFSRTGRGGIFQVDTDGFVAAAFTHHTSRAGDPQLHSHVLVANKVRCVDGRWRSLDGRELFAFQKAAGMLYNAVLRVELTVRLGLEWNPVDRNGQADIDGVPRELIEVFSKRRQDVERRGAERIAALEARLGRTLTDDERAEQYQFATYDTRPAKTGHGDDEAALGGRWRMEANAAGCDPARWLPDTLERTVAELQEEIGNPRLVAEVIAELAEARSTWSRADVAKAVARRLPPGLAARAEAGRGWIEATCAAVLIHPEVVTLASPLSAEVPVGLRRRDALPSHERHGASRHTTRETLAREGRVLDTLVRGRQAGVAIAAEPDVERAARRHRLGPDQVGALRRICEGGERLVCVVGPAGSGKTRMIRAARDTWAATGIPVRGLAVSAVAAGVLAGEAGIPAETVAKFLHDRRSGDATGGLATGEVVVVDEAAMVASADLAELVKAVESADAKLVLVGDHRQLGAVEAGGLFRLLVADSRAAELHEPRRFVHPWEAQATLRLRNADDTVLDEYGSRGRISGGSREEMIDDALATWRAARAAGESIVVVAPDHARVDALALRARAERVVAGEVEPVGLAVGSQIVGCGDEIVTTRNDRRLVTTGGLWVRNGDRWRIETRRDDGVLVVSHLEGHGQVLLPPDYAAEHVALAYAVTVHKAEGLTVERAVLLADAASTREHLYVGMTRGRIENRVCVVTDAVTTGHGNQRVPEPIEILAGVMRRSSAEVSASETLRAELARGEDPVTLRRLWEQARNYIEAGAGPERRPELRRLERLRSDLPARRSVLALNQRNVEQLDRRIARIRQDLTAAQAQIQELTRRRWLRRPDHHAIGQTDRRIEADQRQVQRLEAERSTAVRQLEHSRYRLEEAERAVARIPDVETAIARRSQWLLSHPAELEWEHELARRLEEVGRSPERDSADRNSHERDDVEGELGIDLRTIDLSPRHPRSSLERSLREALGIQRVALDIDIALPPLPGRGIDGPDLGL